MRRFIQLKYLLILMSMVFLSCRKGTFSKYGFLSSSTDKESALKITDSIGKMEISVSFMPHHHFLNATNKQEAQQDMADLRNHYFFILSLSANHKELLRQLNYSNYSRLVQTLSFEMADYITAESDHDSNILPEQCQFNQTYGGSVANQLLLAFPKSAFKSSSSIRIKIREFGLNTGDRTFDFETSRIRKLEQAAAL